jgi:hypothetical protein
MQYNIFKVSLTQLLYRVWFIRNPNKEWVFSSIYIYIYIYFTNGLV